MGGRKRDGEGRREEKGSRESREGMQVGGTLSRKTGTQ